LGPVHAEDTEHLTALGLPRRLTRGYRPFEPPLPDVGRICDDEDDEARDQIDVVRAGQAFGCAQEGPKGLSEDDSGACDQNDCESSITEAKEAHARRGNKYRACFESAT
jgi:hypothetical protein